jgi:phosphate transport system substrate-binding protein
MKNRLIAVLAALVLIVMSSINIMAQDETIVDVAAGNEDFSTLVSLVDAAGLVETLSGEGPFTVFAPTNDAFAKLSPVLVDYLVANPDALTQVLTYHVVGASVMSGDLAEGQVETLDMGNTVDVALPESGPRINNARVVIADVAASNGVIHAIDTVLLPPVELPAVDPLAITENIIGAGSSTVFPLTERMADLFNQDGYAGTITVDSIGSGAGYERFCVNVESDVQNASRAIRPEEVESCRSNGIEPAEFFVAIDALAISVSEDNDFVDNLTLEQVAQVFSGEFQTWDEINPDWPAEEIRLFSPGSDSGTYDYFVEEIYDEDEGPIQNAPGIQFSEDDNVLVQGVQGSPNAIAYFGYAYFQENEDSLRPVAVEGVIPSEETGITGEYPLSRPLFIYSAPSIMQEKPQVAAFVNYYLQNANPQLGPDSDQIGYIPTGEYVGRLNAWTWIAATGGEMGGM